MVGFMKRNFCCLIIVIFLLTLSSLYADEIVSVKKVLPNGLTVIVSKIPASPFVSLYALVKTGSATEGKFLGSGISHFVEHLMFKGTSSRGVGEIPAQIKAMGGTINASTGKDFTVYKITVPYECFDKALEIFSDMLMHPVFDPKQMEKERDVILKEMNLDKDNPDRYFSDITFENVYVRHPYKYPVIGYIPLFASIKHSDVLEYYHAKYVPNNMIFSVAGNVEPTIAISKIEHAFRDFKRGRCIIRNLVNEPFHITKRIYEEEYPTDLARLSISFMGVGILDHDLYALDVLAMILGRGRSSRLYQSIYKDKSLVHSISASNYTPIDRGAFEIDALLEADKLQATIDAIFVEIDKIKKGGVTDFELNRAKRQILSEYIMNRQRSSDVAYSQALDEAYTGDYRFSKRYVEQIKKVTPEDIKRVVNKYLIEQGATIVILRPKLKSTVKNTSRIDNEIKIKKFTLSNGLVVLIREDHRFPLVSLQVVFNGGVRQEPEGLNGCSKLMASVLLKGTKSKTQRQLAEQIDSLGMNVTTFSGTNSFGIKMNFLSEDVADAFAILEDIIKNPIFPEDEIEKTKDNMRTNLKKRDEDIVGYSVFELKKLLFKNSPFSRDSNGTFYSISKITRKDIVDFYRKYVVPNNMVVSIFGDVNETDILRLVKEKFGMLKRKEIKLNKYNQQPIMHLKQKKLYMHKDQAMVVFGFHGVRIYDEDKYGLEVLASIIGSPFNGRLFHRIREDNGYAYAVGGRSIPGLDTGFILFYALTSKGNVNKVKELIKDEISYLQKNYVSEKELEDTKNYLKGRFKSMIEVNASLASLAGFSELYGLGYDNYKRYEAAIDSVTKEDILRLAIKYLDLNRTVIVVTMPKEDSVIANVRAIKDR